MTTVPKELLIQWRSALETGLDCARNKAEDTHASYKGYYPERHAAVDRDVTDIEAATAALQAAIDQPDPEEVYKHVAYGYDFSTGKIGILDENSVTSIFVEKK